VSDLSGGGPAVGRHMDETTYLCWGDRWDDGKYWPPSDPQHTPPCRTSKPPFISWAQPLCWGTDFWLTWPD